VLPVDRVTAVHDARADEEHVIGRVRVLGKQAQRGRHHRGAVAAQHAPVINVAGIPCLARDGRRKVAQAVVIVGDGHDPWAAAPAGRAAPGAGQRRYGQLGDHLDGVRRPLGRIGQIGDRKVARKLRAGEHGGHRDSLNSMAGREITSRPGHRIGVTR